MQAPGLCIQTLRTVDGAAPARAARRAAAAACAPAAPEARDAPSHDRVRPVVLGAIDGMVTSFVVVASGFAGRVEYGAVVLIAVASLVADAVSMTASEYLSSRSTQRVTVADARRQAVLCGAAFLAGGAPTLVAFTATGGDTSAARVVQAIVTTATFCASVMVVGYLRGVAAGAPRARGASPRSAPSAGSPGACPSRSLSSCRRPA
jgi:VIT1/CCC1 family predicted Fe2+/Mn2+ transporter